MSLFRTASSPVPPVKLSPPAAHPFHVARAGIAELVQAAGAVPLVLVRAPAGFGKTTTLLQLRERLEADGIATAWLTLDAADNDLPRFLAGLAAAAMQLGIESTTDGAPSDAIQALARTETPFALFLDDLETIHDPAVWNLLRALAAGLPRRGRLFVASRSLPDLGLGRLRARGQLLEIDVERLRFSARETVEFFGRRGGPALPAQALDRLHQKTEGWIAALWLAAMALARREGPEAAAGFVERFSGSDRALADYLAEDVLAQQPAEVREFLLRTSILRQLGEPVCRALLPRADVPGLLRHVEAMQLFVSPAGGDEQVHRYHPLFAEFLRAQLARTHPDDVARLHLAASGWYESQQRPVPAIDHAIEGGDHPHAMHLLARHAEGFLEQGRMRLLDRWFAALPAERLRARPLMQVVAVWAQCFTHGPWQALRTLEDAGCAAVDDAAVQAHVNALRPLLLAMMDRHEEASAAGEASLARLPSCRPFADGVLANAMANIVSVMGRPQEAHRLLDAARRTLHGSSRFNRMYTESMEGLLDLKEGRLRQAAARLRIAVGTTPRPDVTAPSLSQGNAWAGVLYAGALYETNQLDAALHLLNVYGPLAREVGLPDHMIASHRMRSRIAFQRGDVDAALQLLIELEYLGQQRQLPRVVASAKLERARVLLLQGHARAAADELDRADDAALWERVRLHQFQAHEVEDLPIGRWRWQIHFGDAAAAASALEPAITEARQASRHHRALKLRLLFALARARLGAPASDEFDAVLRDAGREGFVRLVLDEGPIVAAGVRALRSEAAASMRADDPVHDAWLQRLAELLGVAGPADDDPAAAPTPSTEPLTRKEIHVLQLLAEGYSNAAMAEKLFVSDSTVRTHLRSINQKLGARSRTQAIALARRAGVVR